MRDQDTRARVHEAIKRVAYLPLKELNDTQRLAQDLELDSLDQVELCMDLEEAFGIEIPDEAVETWQTVGDVIQAVAA